MIRTRLEEIRTYNKAILSNLMDGWSVSFTEMPDQAVTEVFLYFHDLPNPLVARRTFSDMELCAGREVLEHWLCLHMGIERRNIGYAAPKGSGWTPLRAHGDLRDKGNDLGAMVAEVASEFTGADRAILDACSPIAAVHKNGTIHFMLHHPAKETSWEFDREQFLALDLDQVRSYCRTAVQKVKIALGEASICTGTPAEPKPLFEDKVEKHAKKEKKREKLVAKLDPKNLESGPGIAALFQEPEPEPPFTQPRVCPLCHRSTGCMCPRDGRRPAEPEPKPRPLPIVTKVIL